MPHRVALLCPGLVLDEKDRRLVVACALLQHTLAFELLLEHGVVAIATPRLGLYQDSDGRSPLVPGHPERALRQTELFEVQRFHELLTFTLDLRPKIGGSRGSLRGLRHDGETLELEAPAGIPLSVVVEGCLLRWLRGRRFPLPSGALPPFDVREFLLAARHIRTRLNGYDGTAAGASRALEDAPRVLATTVRRALMLAWNTPRPALILADAPDDLWAQREMALLGVRKRTISRVQLRGFVERAPQWGHARLSLFGSGLPRDEQLRHQSVAATVLPTNPVALTNYAVSLLGLGRADEAYRFADRATRLDAGSLAAQLAALNTLRVIGRPGQAYQQAQARLESLEGLVAAGRLASDAPKLAMARLLKSLIAMDGGRRDEAIRIRREALEKSGTLVDWDRQAELLEAWQIDPDVIARAYARASHHRGMPASVVEGFRRAVPERGTDLAKLVSALLDLGDDRLAFFVYAQHRTQRLGRHAEARLAGAHVLLTLGELEAGLEQIQIVQLRLPQAMQETRVERLLRLAAARPPGDWVSAIVKRTRQGAHRLAWMAARDAADFVPGLGADKVVLASLGLTHRSAPPRYDPRWLIPLRQAMAGPEVADASELEELMAGAAREPDPLWASDDLVNRWLGVCGPPRSDRVSAWVYVLAASLTRYFAASTAIATPLTGAYRQIATAALTGLHRLAQDVPRVLYKPLLRGLATARAEARVDARLWDSWMLRVERALDLNSRVGHIARVSGGVALLESTLRNDLQVSFELRLADSYAQQQSLQDAACELYERCFRAIGAPVATPLAEVSAAVKPLTVALDTLWTVTVASPGVAAPRLALADVLFRSGEGQCGVEVLSQAARLLPDADRQRVLGKYRGVFEGAVDVPFEPANARAAGMAMLSEGRAERALACLQWAAANAPGDSAVQAAVGQARSTLGQVVEATDAFSKVDVVEGPRLAAQALLEAGHSAAARAAFQVASLGYRTGDEWLGSARGLFALGSFKEAIEAFEIAEAMGAEPSSGDLWQLAISWGRLGDIDESEITARQLIAMAAGDRTAGVAGWTLMAKIELTRGSSGSAQRALEKALELDPDTLVELEGLEPIDGPACGDTDATRAFEAIRRAEFSAVPTSAHGGDWRLARAQLTAASYLAGGRLASDDPLATRVLLDSRGSRDVDALLCRIRVLEQRESSTYGVDPPMPPPEVASVKEFAARWKAASNARDE